MGSTTIYLRNGSSWYSATARESRIHSLMNFRENPLRGQRHDGCGYDEIAESSV